MSGFICPKCGEKTDIFKTGGGEEMARDMGVPFLGRVPVDPQIVAASDEGKPYVVDFPHTEAGKIFAAIAAPILALDAGERPDSSAGAERDAPDREAGAERDARDRETGAGKHASGTEAEIPDAEQSMNEDEESRIPKGGTMKIAVPVSDGRLSMHFGHCEEFALVEVDNERKKVLGSEMLQAPPHEPGRLPVWLNEQGASLVIAGGMGQRAQALFRDKGVDVIVGAPADEPEAVVRAYLDGCLVTGSNVCDH